jgi:hypothetical protein
MAEIRVLSTGERVRLLERLRELEGETPADFLEALADFKHGRFVTMETALNDTPSIA